MTSRPIHVPKFGNWDGNDHMPFTAVFGHARAGRSQGINPNDPTQNLGILSGIGSNDNSSPSNRLAINSEDGIASPNGCHVSQASTDDGESLGQLGSAATKNPDESLAQGHEIESFPVYFQGETRVSGFDSTGKRQASKESLSDSGCTEGQFSSLHTDQSPIHPASHQGRTNRPGAASPAWESRRKASGDGGQIFAPATPGRSRLRSGNSRAEDLLDRGAALPKFGAWDAKDPASGDGFTVIFNNARNEKKTGGPVRIPQMQQDSILHSEDDLYKQPSVTQTKPTISKKWYCCFQPSVKT